MKFPSKAVWRSSFSATAKLTAVSLVLSASARWVAGQEYDLVLFSIRGLVSAAILLPLSLVVMSRLERLEQAYADLMQEAQDLARQAATDPLTGLMNRRSFEGQFDTAMQHRAGGTFLVADVDYLKTINDDFGHTVGDDAIMAAGDALVQVLGDGWLIARIGGDEFACFAPTARIERLDVTAARINAVATSEFLRRSSRPEVTLTMSIGMQRCPSGSTFRMMLANTDSDLYRKKINRPRRSA